MELFETFVGPDDNWLPPDNYQEQPVAVVAHRTSPTNMGLALLANLSACDFGYITMRQFIERTANTLRTMEAMDRIKVIFITGMIRNLWNRCCHSTFRRWTAETLQDIC